LRPRLLSEGLTTRTSLSRISCHSSVVKVQRPRRDGPRRRHRMMRLGRRGVKPRDPVNRAPGLTRATSRGGGTTANGMGAHAGCQTDLIRVWGTAGWQVRSPPSCLAVDGQHAGARADARMGLADRRCARCRLSRGTTGIDDEQTRAAAETFIGLLADEITGPTSLDVSAAT